MRLFSCVVYWKCDDKEDSHFCPSILLPSDFESVSHQACLELLWDVFVISKEVLLLSGRDLERYAAQLKSSKEEALERNVKQEEFHDTRGKEVQQRKTLRYFETDLFGKKYPVRHWFERILKTFGVLWVLVGGWRRWNVSALRTRRWPDPQSIQWIF